MDEGQVDEFSLDEAWTKGYAWIETEALGPTAAWAAMLFRAAGQNRDRASELVAGVLTVSMVASAYVIGVTPRTLAESMFQGLASDEDWPKVVDRISAYIDRL